MFGFWWGFCWFVYLFIYFDGGQYWSLNSGLHIWSMPPTWWIFHLIYASQLIFSFLRNLYPVFYNLHSWHPCIRFLLLHILTSMLFFCFCFCSYSNWSETVSPHLDLHYPEGWWYWEFFSCIYWWFIFLLLSNLDHLPIFKLDFLFFYQVF
jgi:hypothetical protein